ncbi:sodium/proton-translocating pyrophosphatase [Candidatus Methylospira mobilis]|uniref:sodium/proton-translocating pyrophosphatase n=1 Tax=Candidatus Methylospira mobilis TaxID=1808979 RepID=UPI0028EB0595|nr:sodium/proton-translocating pyrophosphatase [Candidatus Methylospira mobilis]WNV06547.1 sodium/proton-translocating pyrophosphatase [Candidatus Methylospira mobilis]
MPRKLLDSTRQWIVTILSDRRNRNLAVIGLIITVIIGIEESWGSAFAFLSALLALLECLNTLDWLHSRPSANGSLQGAVQAIQQAADACWRRLYKTLAAVAALLLLPVAWLLDWDVVGGFAAGSILSALAGYLGLTVSIRSHGRAAQAAQQGLPAVFGVVFKGAAVTGLLVAALGLLGVAGCYAILTLLGSEEPLSALVGFVAGASLVSIFARVCGGIISKAADIAGDVSGQPTTDSPALDLRNPASITQRLGESIRDGVGMAGDLFETYTATLMATMLLAAILTGGLESAVAFPLLLGGASLLASVVALASVRLEEGHILAALLRIVLVAAGLSSLTFYPLCLLTFGGGMQMGSEHVSAHGVYFAALTGFALSAALVALAGYYTSASYAPLRSVAVAARGGIANLFTAGLVLAMRSTLLPILAVCTAIWAAHAFAGLFGVAVAATAMLSLTGLVAGLDVFNPIAANAGYISELADTPAAVRHAAREIAAAGRALQALTRGYALGGAALAAVVIFADYTDFLAETAGFVLLDYRVVVGLLLGALIPYLFVALLIPAVNRPAAELVNEVRRQWRTRPGIFDRTDTPEYARAADQLTRLSLQETVLPVLLPILIPIAAGFLLGAEVLGGLLLGALVTGLLLAITLSTAGSVWGNARKYIEEGHYGGQDSEAAKAASTTDAVGAPLKDVVGPALGVMIKAVSIVGLLIAPLL